MSRKNIFYTAQRNTTTPTKSAVTACFALFVCNFIDRFYLYLA